MKTLLFIEKDRSELDVLVGIFREWRRDVKILTAMDEKVAIQLLANHPVDIIFCALDFSEDKTRNILEKMTEKYPYIPLITIGDNGANKSNEMQKIGGVHYHERPLNSEILLAQVEDLFGLSTTGTIKGIPLHSFLQMLEGDAKTCTIQCSSGNTLGYIYMVDGVLIDADCGEFTQEDAVYEMISWEDPIMWLRFFNGKRPDKVKKPLMSIIMEGMRLKDEKSKARGEENVEKEKVTSFKRFLTAGHRLSLDIGEKVSVEFEGIDSALSSVVVGMIPDCHLITTIPDHFSVMEIQPKENSGVMVKYLHMGSLCLFKSVILRAIHHPTHLLFLSYPTLIHYQELRKAKRVAVYIPCTLIVAGEAQFQGALIDLSYTGGLCQMISKDIKQLPNVQIGEEVTIGCMLPGLADEQHFYGIVRNFQKNMQEARIGIEFYQLSSPIKNTIKHYLDSIETIQT